MDDRDRLVQRAVDGTNPGISTQRVVESMLADDPSAMAQFRRLEELDRRLRARLASHDAIADDALIARIHAAIPATRPTSEARLPAAWIATALAAGCLILLVPLMNMPGHSPLAQLAWQAIAVGIGILLLLAAALPLRPGSPLLRVLLHTSVPLGPTDRLACIAAGACLLIAAGVLLR